MTNVITILIGKSQEKNNYYQKNFRTLQYWGFVALSIHLADSQHHNSGARR
jgi:hypothetical protein